MAEISELERRIKDALDRIGAGVEHLTVPTTSDPADSVDSAEFAALQEALEAEKLATSQLEERIKNLHAQHDEKIRALEEHVDTLKSANHEARGQVQQVQRTNQHLSASLQSLREAAMQGIEPHLINKAMMSELDGLRALRDADRAELDAILGQLQPMLKEA